LNTWLDPSPDEAKRVRVPSLTATSISFLKDPMVLLLPRALVAKRRYFALLEKAKPAQVFKARLAKKGMKKANFECLP
jgi:hypothetical protein